MYSEGESSYPLVSSLTLGGVCEGGESGTGNPGLCKAGRDLRTGASHGEHQREAGVGSRAGNQGTPTWEVGIPTSGDHEADRLPHVCWSGQAGTACWTQLRSLQPGLQKLATSWDSRKSQNTVRLPGWRSDSSFIIR